IVPVDKSPTIKRRGGNLMKVALAADHGGFEMKQLLIGRLRQAGHEVIDFGAASFDAADDYPDFVIPLAQAVAAGKVERGIVICGSGVGASVAVNKVHGIRAGLCHDHLRLRILSSFPGLATMSFREEIWECLPLGPAEPHDWTDSVDSYGRSGSEKEASALA